MAAGVFIWGWLARAPSPLAPELQVDSQPSAAQALLVRRLEAVEFVLRLRLPEAEDESSPHEFLLESYRILVRLADEYLLADLLSAHKAWFPTSVPKSPIRKRIHGRLADVFSHLLGRTRRVRSRVQQSLSELAQLYIREKGTKPLPEGWTVHDFNRVYEALRLTTDRHLCTLPSAQLSSEEELLVSATVAALIFNSFSTAAGNQDAACIQGIPARSRLLANQLLEHERVSTSAAGRARLLNLCIEMVDNTDSALSFSERAQKLKEIAEEIRRDSTSPFDNKVRVQLTKNHLVACFKTGLRFPSEGQNLLLQVANDSLGFFEATEVLPQKVLKDIQELPDRKIGHDPKKNPALEAFRERLRAFSARRPPGPKP